MSLLQALCTEAALNAVQRRYPQIYKSNERLLLNPESIEVGLRDFMISIKSPYSFIYLVLQSTDNYHRIGAIICSFDIVVRLPFASAVCATAFGDIRAGQAGHSESAPCH